MENALLIGLSRQTALARQLEVIANNMANLRTPGFKGESLMFEEYLMPGAQVTDASGSDARLSYVYDVGLARDFSTGQFERTDNELDVAIEGQGWLVAETPEGPRYTRDGALKISAEGLLVSGAGNTILGEGGPIQFAPGDHDIVIANDGTISTADGERGRLKLVAFENQSTLEKIGNNMFSASEEPKAADKVRIVQGMIERSNVQPVVETARMIEVTRAYATTAQLLDQMQDLRRDAIERLGTVPN
ncbi:MAG: flagellar basal-body rod protein FlgF [Rhodobiaceae bacterium]|nr:flagellar basal-body rod protein FlgF [Rhodobiaceae bacterium]